MLKANFRYLLIKKTDKNSKLRSLVRPEEHYIIEVSESGFAFKTRLLDGTIRWEMTENWEVMEQLPNKE